MTNQPSHGKGRFITLDGSEGVGKSTQLSLIEQWLNDQRISYLLTREPGGTPLGEQLRALLLHHDTQADDLSELFIILAARRQHLVEKIWPALAKGHWVICDRFNDATYAYQGFGRGIDTAIIASLEQTIMGDFIPDKRFIFHLAPEIAEQRLVKRARHRDRFEQQERDFFTRIAQGFQHRLQTTNAIEINASGSIDEVFAQIKPHLEALIE